MKYLRIFPLLCITWLSPISGVAQAADDALFLEQITLPLEQAMGQGQSALWTMPLVATQYQPLQPTPVMQSALQAQNEGRFLNALILLEDAIKSEPAGTDTRDEMDLLRASFLLQGSQYQQVMEILVPLQAKPRYAADAWALTAMTQLQQGKIQQALESAKQAQNFRDGILPHLALSYALQGAGRLAEAREAMHKLNSRAPQQAIALAREAELALTLDQIQSARTLAAQARGVEAQPYVIAVSGFTWLIDGHAQQAKAAFETALQRDPKDAKALLGLGLAEAKLGNFPECLKKLQAAHESDPGNALILTYLGRAQQQAGQTEAARASWRSAQQADPRDPAPWLYQAQAELQANRPLQARESLREAQARTAYRAVYRGKHLLREDEQLLQANLAEIQRRLGQNSLAFHTLTDSPGEKNAANLRNQADLLQGQRFGESARRSLLLQSLFNDKPGNLPATLDIYGDGAGQTGAATPQHGAISALNTQHASYNDYDELFTRRTTLEADTTTGSKHSNGEQIRLGVGNGTLGLGIAQLQFNTDGYAPFETLDNRAAQATVQWRPTQSTQVLVSHQTFNSQRGEVYYPADQVLASNYLIEDNSRVARLGLRHSLTDNSELRALWSHQQTDQASNYEVPFFVGFSSSTYGSSNMHSEELQYHRSGAAYTTQWGMQQMRGGKAFWDASGSITSNDTQHAQQFYAAWQQILNPHWQLGAELGWGKIDNQDNITPNSSTSLTRWLPKLGMVYTPDSRTHVRLAAWQNLGSYTAGDATLAPVSLAGVLLSRPGDNGKLVHAVALGGDRQLSPAWLLTAQAQQRNIYDPVTTSGQQNLLRQQVDESSLALHWQPQGKPWTVNLAYDHERIQNDPDFSSLDSVDQQNLRSQQLTMRWFASAHWTANLAWSHNWATGSLHSTDPILWSSVLLPYQNSFNQLDADLSWQFNRSRGLLTAGVRNANDIRFQYTDIDRLNPRFSNGRLVYAKLKLAW